MSATDFAWEEWKAKHPALATPAEGAYAIGVEWGSQRAWAAARLLIDEVAEELEVLATNAEDRRARFAINVFVSMLHKAIDEIDPE